MSLKPIFATYDWKANPIIDAYKFCPLCGASLVWREVSHKTRPTCAACGYIHFKNPATGVSVFVVDDGRVLLTKRDSDLGGGKWALPSGYIEYDEDFLTAGIREVKEETGLDVVIRSIINVESAFMNSPARKPRSSAAGRKRLFVRVYTAQSSTFVL